MPGRNSVTDVPEQFLPLGPNAYEMLRDDNTGIPEGIGLRNASNPNELKMLKESEYIFIRYFNPHDWARGQSAYRAVSEGVRGDHLAQIFNNSFLENGAEPGGILTTDKRLDDRAIKNLKSQIKEHNAGPNKAGEPLIAHGGLRWHQLGSTHKDMQYQEGRKWNRQEVSAAWGVPLSELSVHEGLNNSLSLSADKSFWQKSLLPRMKFLATAINSFLMKFIAGGRYWVGWDTSVVEALREEFTAKIKNAFTLWRMGWPINAINARLGLGMGDVDWGNEWWIVSNLVPAAQLQEAIDIAGLPGFDVDEEEDEEPEDDEEPDEGDTPRVDDEEPDEDDDEEPEGGSEVPPEEVSRSAAVELHKKLKRHVYQLRNAHTKAPLAAFDVETANAQLIKLCLPALANYALSCMSRGKASSLILLRLKALTMVNKALYTLTRNAKSVKDLKAVYNRVTKASKKIAYREIDVIAQSVMKSKGQ
jgi:HK97 family phage portal protein